MDLNRAQIIGNITQDLELKQTPNWQSVVSFSVATNRTWVDSSWMKQEQVEFHNIVLWWKLAEIAAQYLRKWRKIFIEWRLQTRTWDAQDWTKRYKTEIIWDNMIMLDWKADNTATTPENTDISTPANETSAVTKKATKKEEEISIEDIPF
jgi:single-strand DNA-binding protein